MGTLSEMAIVWGAAQTEPDAPLLILVGAIWHSLYPVLTEKLIVSSSDANLPIITRDYDEVLSYLARGNFRRVGSGPMG